MLVHVVDRRMHKMFYCEQLNIEIYYYEEENKNYSVVLEKNGKKTVYASFSHVFAVKKMCYWLIGKIMANHYDVSDIDFINGMNETGMKQWFVA